jgi:hypothetical protein
VRIAIKSIKPHQRSPTLRIEFEPNRPYLSGSNSIASTCFRRKSGSAWQRASLRLAPRSVYLLSGPARTQWEHSIPPLAGLCYSITF